MRSLNEKHKFHSKYLTDFLTGIRSVKIIEYQGDQHKKFGHSLSKDEKFWNAVIRQCIVNGLIDKEVETYGTLKCSEKGLKHLHKPTSCLLSQNHDYDHSQNTSSLQNEKQMAFDEALVKILKDLRKQVAQQKKVPPFVVFQDPSLEDMAINYPCNE